MNVRGEKNGAHSIQSEDRIPLWFEDSVKVKASHLLLCFSDLAALTPISDSRILLIKPIRICTSLHILNGSSSVGHLISIP